ncbi:MAG: M10 family metallopeptidase C-terminal domain-containing protein [Devosia nanyangense]|uniref:M10 family metallopeptidase C-terminal domain-containing protein n=1 Tax=Devosia nanyangense TaxID=1228055 RepID=A0A933L165_9HYPH|nr:M10 family metallopeptidase C-terminal domain-containing protein [Devosia nanyangense]
MSPALLPAEALPSRAARHANACRRARPGETRQTGDRFDFNSVAEIGLSLGQRDIIADFVHGTDKIDLSTIDAKIGSGNQAFSFIAAEGHSFGHHKGELIWDKQNNAGTVNDRTVVSGDIDGDGVADFSIELHGLVSLTKWDFVL